jgi:hypothetical protein
VSAPTIANTIAISLCVLLVWGETATPECTGYCALVSAPTIANKKNKTNSVALSPRANYTD